MNKVFLGLILAVCVLGMALVMLNDRLGRKPDARPAPVAETAQKRTPEEIAAAARAMELAEAALAPPSGQETKIDEPVTARVPGREIVENQVPNIEPRPELAPARPVRETKVEAAPRPAPRSDAPVAKPEPPAGKPEPAPAKLEQQPGSKPVPAPAMSEPVVPKAAAGGKTATKFVIYARDKGATVRVGGNAKVEYTSMTLENPNRVVVDLTGDWKFPSNPGIPKNELVSAVRVGQNGDKTRLVIDLKIKPRKVVLVPFKNGDGVDVRVDK